MKIVKKTVFVIATLTVSYLSSSSYAATGVTTVERLENYKIKLLQEAQEVYDTQNEKFVNNEDMRQDFHTLVCLQVLSGTGAQQLIDTSYSQVRKDILEEYVTYKADLERYDLGLDIDIDLLRQDIDTYYDAYIERIQQLSSEIDTTIVDMQELVSQYQEANPDLLKDLSNTMEALTALKQDYAKLTGDIQQFTSGYFDIFDIIHTQKSLLTQKIHTTIDPIIAREQNLYKDIIVYVPLLEAKKASINRLLQQQVDELVQSIMDMEYDASIYGTIQSSRQTLSTQIVSYSPNYCQQILLHPQTDTNITLLQSNIQSFQQQLSNLHKPMLASGDLQEQQEKLQEWFSYIFTTALEKQIQEFTDYKSRLFTDLATINTEQRNMLMDLQKDIVTFLQFPTQSQTLKNTLITRARDIYNQSVMQSVQDEAAKLLMQLDQEPGQPVNSRIIYSQRIQSDNIFVPLLYTLAETHQNTNEQFAQKLSQGLPNLASKIESSSTDRRLVLQYIYDAVELYVQAHK
jgi:uncharacterized protein (UPF0335 family)